MKRAPPATGMLSVCVSEVFLRSEKTNLKFAAESQKADSIMRRLYLSPEGFLIIQKLLCILLQLWMCIRLHNRQEQQFSRRGHVALLNLRLEQKSIIALEGSLRHAHTHTRAHTSVW